MNCKNCGNPDAPIAIIDRSYTHMNGIVEKKEFLCNACEKAREELEKMISESSISYRTSGDEAVSMAALIVKRAKELGYKFIGDIKSISIEIVRRAQAKE